MRPSPIRAALVGLALCANAPLQGEELDLSRLVPLDDQALTAQRGGLALGGLDIRLGADIRTYINGDLALQTIINWGSQEGSSTQIVSGALAPADAQALAQGVLNTGSITMRVGDSNVFLANAGQTAVIHRVDGPVQNIVINTASNTSLVQEVDASIDIAGYSVLEGAALESRMMAQMNADIDLSAIGSVTH